MALFALPAVFSTRPERKKPSTLFLSCLRILLAQALTVAQSPLWAALLAVALSCAKWGLIWLSGLYILGNKGPVTGDLFNLNTRIFEMFL